MELKTELLYRFIIGMGLVYIFGKVLGPAILQQIYQFFTGKKYKKDVDLDTLIERKKEMLRRGMPSPTKQGQKTSKKKYSSRTQKAYSEAYNDEENKEKKEDYKKVLALLDNFSWGEGAEISRLTKKCREHFQVEVTNEQLIKTIRLLIVNELILERKEVSLRSFKDIEELIIISQFITLLALELSTGEAVLIEKLSKKMSFSKKVMTLCLVSTFMKKDIETLFSLIPEEIKELCKLDESVGLRKLIESSIFQDKEIILNYEGLIKEIRKSGNLIKSLIPIAEINKNSIEDAFNVLELEKGANLQKVKDQYKKLAKLRHPDKLGHLNLSSDLMDVAKSNFTTIKSAYDIIKESYSSK